MYGQENWGTLPNVKLIASMDFWRNSIPFFGTRKIGNFSTHSAPHLTVCGIFCIKLLDSNFFGSNCVWKNIWTYLFWDWTFLRPKIIWNFKYFGSQNFFWNQIKNITKVNSPIFIILDLLLLCNAVWHIISSL